MTATVLAGNMQEQQQPQRKRTSRLFRRRSNPSSSMTTTTTSSETFGAICTPPPVAARRANSLPSPSRRPSLKSCIKITAPVCFNSQQQTTTTSTESNNDRRKSRVVSFGLIDIREYERVVDINPSVTCGPALGLGWSYNVCKEAWENPNLTVDAYEQYRSKRRGKLQLQLALAVRHAIIKQQIQPTKKELQAAIKASNIGRNRRRATNATTAEMETAQYLLEKSVRKFRKLWNKGRPSELDTLLMRAAADDVDSLLEDLDAFEDDETVELMTTPMESTTNEDENKEMIEDDTEPVTEEEEDDSEGATLEEEEEEEEYNDDDDDGNTDVAEVLAAALDIIGHGPAQRGGARDALDISATESHCEDDDDDDVDDEVEEGDFQEEQVVDEGDKHPTNNDTDTTTIASAADVAVDKNDQEEIELKRGLSPITTTTVDGSLNTEVTCTSETTASDHQLSPTTQDRQDYPPEEKESMMIKKENDDEESSELQQPVPSPEPRHESCENYDNHNDVLAAAAAAEARTQKEELLLSGGNSSRELEAAVLAELSEKLAVVAAASNEFGEEEEVASQQEKTCELMSPVPQKKRSKKKKAKKSSKSEKSSSSKNCDVDDDDDEAKSEQLPSTTVSSTTPSPSFGSDSSDTKLASEKSSSTTSGEEEEEESSATITQIVKSYKSAPTISSASSVKSSRSSKRRSAKKSSRKTSSSRSCCSSKSRKAIRKSHLDSKFGSLDAQDSGDANSYERRRVGLFRSLLGDLLLLRDEGVVKEELILDINRTLLFRKLPLFSEEELEACLSMSQDHYMLDNNDDGNKRGGGVTWIKAKDAKPPKFITCPSSMSA